jgi:hypothetical protein
LPFSLGSGLQPWSELPCEQSSPGDPGTVEAGGPFPLPGSASAADTPRPATSSTAIPTILATASFAPFISVPSLITGNTVGCAVAHPRDIPPLFQSWERGGNTREPKV